MRELRNFAEATLALGTLARPGAGAHTALEPREPTAATGDAEPSTEMMPIGALLDVPFKDGFLIFSTTLAVWNRR